MSNSKTFARRLVPLAAAAALGACGYVDAYEKQVHDWEPVYCYKSLAATKCYREPYHRDKRRLVNYFGPHPSRYDAPPPPEPNLQAPPKTDYWVKDPEPLPRPAPKGDLRDRPWLMSDAGAGASATPPGPPPRRPKLAMHKPADLPPGPGLPSFLDEIENYAARPTAGGAPAGAAPAPQAQPVPEVDVAPLAQ